MQITSATYREDGCIEAMIAGVVWIVPNDPRNRHRKALAEWEAAGGEIAPHEG